MGSGSDADGDGNTDEAHRARLHHSFVRETYRAVVLGAHDRLPGAECLEGPERTSSIICVGCAFPIISSLLSEIGAFRIAQSKYLPVSQALSAVACAGVVAGAADRGCVLLRATTSWRVSGRAPSPG